MVETSEKQDPVLLEKSVAEAALPCHLLWLTGRSVVAAGYQFRPDMAQRLNVGAAAPLAALDSVAAQRVARRVDDVANKALFSLAPDDPLHGLYTCAMFSLLLVDEGLLADATSMSVLVSMLLIDDLKTEGGVEKYLFKEFLLKTDAGKLLSKVRKEGLYDLQLTAKRP